MSYCKKIKKGFNKSLVMSAVDEERLQLSHICWIYDKFFDAGDKKVRDNCHITRTSRGSAQWSGDSNLKLTEKVPLIFHNRKGYGSHLIMQEISKFDVKVNVISNSLEKYMAFTIKKIVYIDIMQFINSSLVPLVKNMSDNLLELVKQKGVCPYECMDSFKKFFSSLKD